MESNAQGNLVSALKMEPGMRLWVGIGDGVIGPGSVRLLAEIGQSGSMALAAERCGMSYSKAYTLIGRLEGNSGCKLLVRQSGGASGGKSDLTETARELISRYDAFIEALREPLNAVFAEHFAGFENHDPYEKSPRRKKDGK